MSAGQNRRRAQILALYQSGELLRLARLHGTMAKIGAACGMTGEALRGCWRALVAGGEVPPWIDFVGDGLTSPVLTSPAQDNSPAHEKWPSVAAFDAAKPEPPLRTVDDDLADRKERSQVSDLKRRLSEALEQLAACRMQLGTADEAIGARVDVEPIRPRERTHGDLREATFVALASDWHIEERVDPAKVNGVNEYNLEIARRRVERYFVGLIYMLRYHRDHFAITDMIQWLGGDLITGYLRDEDREDNECSPVQAVAHLHVWIEEGIRSVLDAVDIETMNVVCNSGNHGRLTKKVQPRTREENSIEWLLYVGLARAFANEPRIKFTLPHGVMTYVQVYDYVLRFTHGDATKYGGGVGGIMIPIRKAIAKWDTVRRAHCTIMGHYHSEHFLRDLVVNGSLVGYNEFALEIAAPFEEPRQSCFLVDKHRGVTMPATIYGEPHRRVA